MLNYTYNNLDQLFTSVTNVIGPDGNVVKGYTYDEFGNTEESETDFLNDITFTSSVADTSSNLQYMNARFYQPATGRFLSQDTYSGNAYDPWTHHLYAYCGNNPTTMVDPTGHGFLLLLFGILVVEAAVAIADLINNNDKGYTNPPETLINYKPAQPNKKDNSLVSAVKNDKIVKDTIIDKTELNKTNITTGNRTTWTWRSTGNSKAPITFYCDTINENPARAKVGISFNENKNIGNGTNLEKSNSFSLGLSDVGYSNTKKTKSENGEYQSGKYVRVNFTERVVTIGVQYGFESIYGENVDTVMYHEINISFEDIINGIIISKAIPVFGDELSKYMSGLGQGGLGTFSPAYI